ncbi:MAG: cyclodeaminase/cyclohydrolase family protein [Anaerolineae bacterium]|nr:cyclodeaminase/cyclohydrolase family protein [Anaerolineae bacterium]
MYNPHMTAQILAERSLSDLTVAGWLDALAAATPAPGGGAAAALAAAMSAALVAMVAGLTVGRPRYAAVEDTMMAVLRRAEALRGELAAAADADTRAYLEVMAAYRLPKEEEPQRAERRAAIQAALRRAAEVPLAVAEAAVELLDLAGRAAALGNPNAASDAAVAALLAHAGLQGAARNVRINLLQIGDDAFVQAAETRITRLLAAGAQALSAALSAADQRG